MPSLTFLQKISFLLIILSISWENSFSLCIIFIPDRIKLQKEGDLCVYGDSKTAKTIG